MQAIIMVKQTNLCISNVTKALFTHSQCLDLATLSKNLLHHLLWVLSFIHTFKDNVCKLYGRGCLVTVPIPNHSFKKPNDLVFKILTS